jgi:hypothetical protein
MKMLNQTFLASLIIIKIVLGSAFIYMVEFKPILFAGDAIASEAKKKSTGYNKDKEKRCP